MDLANHTNYTLKIQHKKGNNIIVTKGKIEVTNDKGMD